MLKRFFICNIVTVFWALIFGEVIGYIASALELMPYSIGQIGCVAALTAFIATNGILLISRVSKS
ncbi:DUF2929 family protein [Lentilactobacillus kosonis]|uniref:DUF2929 family protein n=1 Tax=Lentilactobacillus kosonis TaxID=2810561 RepID=A0A401FL01_9LACO|nr:DUF2929 family protein [Lentilactobacillus kosonis]GAY73064.1 hypothetical protein NBRC111893_1210 [Lentilactobacillus kosonis]